MHRFADVGRHQAGGQWQTFAAQAGDPFRKETQGQRVGGGNRQHLALLAFEVVQVAHHFAKLFDQAARGHQEQLAGLGQLDRGAGTVDQGQAEHAFQAADTSAECRLGDEALFRSLGKAAGGGQGDEVFQPFGFQVHRRLRVLIRFAPV